MSSVLCEHSCLLFHSDYETDEDKPTPPKRTGRPGKQAVKLKAEPESQDESLILDAGDDAVLPSTGKR